MELTLVDANGNSTVTVDVELGSFATADSATDFTAAASTTVIFPPGETEAEVTFILNDDTEAKMMSIFSLPIQVGNDQ